ncbi:MAG: MATE family efflux transporter [Formivibrio sp.]|nr:MATE family efflux transporter [Formivibrio sp.]
MRFNIRRDVLQLALPVLAEQSFFILMGIVNTIMAGRISREAGAATGAVDSINVIFINFFAALSIGATVVVAQYIGQRNIRMANEAVKQALAANTLISVTSACMIWIFGDWILHLLYGKSEPAVMSAMQTYLNITLIGYPLMAITQVIWGCLRGAGDTKTPMKVNIVMNVLNIVLGYVLIYGLHLKNAHFDIDIAGQGVRGAAIGITLARGIGTVLAILIIWRGVSVIRLKNLRHFRFDRAIQRSIFGISTPSGSEALLFNGGKIITQVFIAGMGTVALAANTFAASIVAYMNLPGLALQITLTTMIGQNMGRGDIQEAERTFHYIFKLGTICMTAMGLITLPLAYWFACLFSRDGEIIQLTTRIIQLNCFFMIFWSASFVLPAGLKGAGDAKFTMWATMAGMWIFRIVMGYTLGIALGFGIMGVWMGMFIDWMVRAVLFYLRMVSGKWKTMSVIGRAAPSASALD